MFSSFIALQCYKALKTALKKIKEDSNPNNIDHLNEQVHEYRAMQWICEH